MKHKIILILGFLVLANQEVLAHGDGPDFFSSIGKMYVVVAVLAATFIGIALFMIYIERKITKIENEVSSHK